MLGKMMTAIPLLVLAGPAAAQLTPQIKGCNKYYTGEQVWASMDPAKLGEEADCFGKIGVQSNISEANRRKQIAKLLSLADAEEAELGSDLRKIPASIATKEPIAPLIDTGYPLALSGKPDKVGAFRFVCQPGQISYDDPIVYPGQPGKSHLHQWYGNTLANGKSTYKSLRTTGDSTCVNILNRSAYWMPAMLDGKGHVVRPDYVTIYYKRLPKDDPDCLRLAAKGCVDLPSGLRFIFGYDMLTNRLSSGGTHFDCNGPTAVSGNFANIPDAAKGCSAGNRIGAVINAPPCWDGRLDSPNHRDHIANTSYEWPGVEKCPATHPYVIPAFTMGAWYSVERGDDPTGWYFSSDEMPGMPRMVAGSTFHADWFGAWDDGVLAQWTENCINKLLSCNSGDLGNTTGMKQAGPFSWKANPRLVDIPPRPTS